MRIGGIYTSTIYRSEKTSKTVFRLQLNALPYEEFEYLCVVCEGPLVYPLIGMPLSLEGEFIENNKRDFPTFVFTDVELITTSEEEIRLIPSFKGISSVSLNKLIEAFGVNVFAWKDIPDIYPKLTAIEGIGPGRAKKIVEGIKFYDQVKEFISYVYQYGEHPYINKDENASEMLDKIKKHPYEYGRDCCKLSFRVCDAIARDNGFNANDWERVKALVMETLTRSEGAGNTCLPLDRCFNGVAYYEDHNSCFVNERVSPYVVFAVLMNSPEIVSYINDEEDTYFFLETAYQNERLLANSIKRLQKSNINYNVDVKKILAKTQQELGITYNSSQKEAFRFLASSGIKVLTGGPGTGKTTVINGLVHAFKKLFPEKTIEMMAPTGRAAQRMSEVTHRDAGTLHRKFKLKTSNIEGSLRKRMTSDYVANYPADLVIVDETSMLDSEWSAFTLSSLKSGCTVIFVGDIDQLPSVGAGNVLNDIIASERVDVVRLDVNYRSGNLSTIHTNAIKINSGETDLIEDENFVISQCPDKATMKSRVKQVFYKEFDKNEPFKTQILCAVKEGKCGVYDYNRMAQSTVNKNPTLLETELTEYKMGDKVIINVNNYDQMCFNGDLGIATDFCDGVVTIDLGTKDVLYDQNQYSEISLAYAMSIHKSQGSEYDTVIIVLPEDTSAMLRRNLLYTAVTRAKKKVYIYYMGNALEKAIKNTSSRKRETRLSEMLVKEM